MKRHNAFLLLTALLLSAAAAWAEGPITLSATASVDTRDYTFSVASAYGNPTPSRGTHTYAWRTTVDASVEPVVAVNGEDVACLGWTGTGAVPTSGMFHATGPIVLDQVASSIAWAWDSVESPPGDFDYTIENGEVTITGYTGPGGDVVIPAMIQGLPVTTIGS